MITLASRSQAIACNKMYGSNQIRSSRRTWDGSLSSIGVSEACAALMLAVRCLVALLMQAKSIR